MDYEGQICRPSTEKTAFMLAVAVGCAYNRCKFCVFFKHLRYRLLPLEQIERELERVRGLGGSPEKVFLGDGNAFGMETERLLTIAGLIRRYFPNCRMINMDATVTDLAGKTDEELRRLRAAGVNRLYLGIECGLDDVLAFMRKDHDKAQARRQIERLKAAGLSYNAHIMTGLAGRGRGQENARALAAFFNETRPDRIVNFSLFLEKTAPLRREVEAGLFTPADEVENLREAYQLIELMEPETLIYDGFHDYLGLRVWGELPRDRQKLLARLSRAIEDYSRREPLVAMASQLATLQGQCSCGQR